MSTIGIVGVTGNIGSRVAGGLSDRHDVVGVARDPEGAPDGVRTESADLTDAARAREALASVDALYLTPPEAGEDPLELEREVVTTVIDAARDHGIEHVVMHSAVHADRGDTGAKILDHKHEYERALRDSGLGYTILRPAWYLQNLFMAKDYLEQGMFSLPWPEDMTWAATDIQDVADAAVHFFESGPANRGYDIHLQGGITARQICDAVESVTGQEVQYQEAPDTREAVDAYPISEKHKDAYAELFDYFKATTYLGNPEKIEEDVPGFEYGSIEDFVGRELFVTATV